MVYDEKCLDDRVHILYYEYTLGMRFRISNWVNRICGMGVHTNIVCNQVVYFIGNALPTAIAGFVVLREEEIQPGTLQFRIGGYDIKTLDRELINKSYKDADRKSVV